MKLAPHPTLRFPPRIAERRWFTPSDQQRRILFSSLALGALFQTSKAACAKQVAAVAKIFLQLLGALAASKASCNASRQRVSSLLTWQTVIEEAKATVAESSLFIPGAWQKIPSPHVFILT